MKWSIVLLLVVGVVAAAAAAVLLATLRSGGRGIGGSTAAGEVQIVVATRALEPYTVVQADAVTTRSVPLAQAPRSYLPDPAYAIGKPLRLPMAEGQLFTSACFANDDSPQSVASKLLPPGKRAKTVALSDDAAMQGLLYPGCMVDVLWCFGGGSTSIVQGNAMSKTLLENVPVLAVGRQTALSEDETKESSLSRSRSNNLVTLLVDAHQAEILQLAIDQGAINLVMRNPRDVERISPRPVALASLAGSHAPFTTSQEGLARLLAAARELGRGFGERMQPTSEATAMPQEWETVIIRGDKQQTAKFVMSSAWGASASR